MIHFTIRNTLTVIVSILLTLLIVSCDQPEPSGGLFQWKERFPEKTFEQPVDIVHAGDQSRSIYIVEKPGRIIQLKPDSNAESGGYSRSLFLDITDRVYDRNSEQGLLGLAFHPAFQSNGYFYVNYTTKEDTVIAQYQLTENSNEPPKERVVLRFNQPFDNHNGGDLAFGPDGKLYIATGDGGSGGDPQGHGQNRSSLLGKILRIEVTPDDYDKAYRIPEDNPFVDKKGEMRPEIYAYGLRNPWRIAFDRQTGALWTADVGQNEREEINVIEKGGNYGWNILEGTQCFEKHPACDSVNSLPPVFEYEHGLLGASVTGGFVYRGTRIPALQGHYIFSDFLDGRVWTTRKASEGKYITELTETSLSQITSFGEDGAGELYAVTYEGGLYEMTGPEK